jgi:energy-coupling factor transport system ATP-binding protein
VLVLDEPTFGQDAATWRELVTLLAEQRARGCAVAVVTHDADLVAVLADDRLTL